MNEKKDQVSRGGATGSTEDSRTAASHEVVRALVRIQRKRSKGWRMPEGAVYVGRPTKWGNPWTQFSAGSVRLAVACFREWVLSAGRQAGQQAPYRHELSELRGKDLACWCPLDRPCHADVLLELANKEGH